MGFLDEQRPNLEGFTRQGDSVAVLSRFVGCVIMLASSCQFTDYSLARETVR